MTNGPEQSEPAALATVRRLLLILLSIGMVGTAADLLLLEHYADAWQLPPLVLIAAALVVVVWLSMSGAAPAVTVLRTTMAGFIVAGFAGILLHYNGNREFQREIDPTAAGWALLLKVMRAKAPPALAPASMIQLGLLGLLYTYRHPALRLRVSRRTD